MFRNRIILAVVVCLTLALATSISGTAAAADSGNLHWGSTGTAVKQLQQTLNNQGYWCGNVDGIFGTKTYGAVVKYQGKNGISTTGIVGPITKKALGLTATEAQVSRSGSAIKGKTLTMVATGYDDCWECNYPYYGQPSYIGLPLARGIIATDPNVIPMGTRLYVEGYGEGIAADQGGAIKGNRIDLFFDSKTEALTWGIKTVKVTILD
jgi:3D (Asp-Asp-Asp) domain-containing protein